MADLLIQGGRVVTEEGVAEADVLIDAGRIVAVDPVGRNSTQADEVIDAEGLVVLPGMIDPHVHFNEPGRSDWEGFATGSTALSAGGGTCFFDMPLNSHPPVLTGEAFDAKRATGEAKSRTDFAIWGGLTPDSLEHMDSLAERGVIGFKAFMCASGIEGFDRADERTLRAGMERAAALGRVVAVHAESAETTSRLAAECRRESRTGWRDYLASRPVAAELDAVRVALGLAAETGCRLHVVHVSHPLVAKAVSDAQAAGGVDVTCETCPHYLTFSDDDLVRRGALLKCAPPLRDSSAVQGLWSGLEAGVFAFVGSDHSPCTPSMKAGDNAFEVWGGVAGVQSTLGVLLNRAQRLGLQCIAGLTATAVASRFGLASKGRLAVGFDADLSLIDLESGYELTGDMLQDRHRASPYVGMRFRGVVQRTLVRGATVWRDGTQVGRPAGRLVKPTAGGGAI
ncbi:MAG: allantoinase AllB [Planctomycetota bacterium]